MKALTSALASLFAGGVVFWLADILLSALWTKHHDDGAWREISFACPIVGLTFYGMLAWWRKREPGGPSSALFMLLGIWILAPWLMLLTAALSEGWPPDVSEIQHLYWFLLLTSFLPFLTFFMSTAHGSTYALILVTMALSICHFRYERSRWLIPPGVKATVGRFFGHMRPS